MRRYIQVHRAGIIFPVSSLHLFLPGKTQLRTAFSTLSWFMVYNFRMFRAGVERGVLCIDLPYFGCSKRPLVVIDKAIAIKTYVSWLLLKNVDDPPKVRS